MGIRKQTLNLLAAMIKNQDLFNQLPLEDRWWFLRDPDYAVNLLILSILERNKIRESVANRSEWKNKEVRRVTKNTLKIPEIMGELISAQRKLDQDLSVSDAEWAGKNISAVIKFFIEVIRNKNEMRKAFELHNWKW